RYMLSNEKYVGDVLYQKTFRTDCISKKTKVNRGEVTRYLISNNHPAIIDRDTFNLV
ncbi:MAG: recombinase family protein, partial [Clostridia bacterium]|nr:recombinase family protein [Clostridia bacterium]